MNRSKQITTADYQTLDEYREVEEQMNILYEYAFDTENKLFIGRSSAIDKLSTIIWKQKEGYITGVELLERL